MKWQQGIKESDSGEIEKAVFFEGSNTAHFYRINDAGRKVVYRSEVCSAQDRLSFQMGVMAVQVIQDNHTETRYIQAPPVDYAIASDHIAVLV